MLLFAVPRGLEDVVAAIVGPASAAFRRRGAFPVLEQHVRPTPVHGDFPQHRRVRLAVEQGETQARAVRRPAQPEGTARQRREFPALGPVVARNIKVVAGGVKDALAIGHPGRVVGEDAGNAARGATGGGDDPERLLRRRWQGGCAAGGATHRARCRRAKARPAHREAAASWFPHRRSAPGPARCGHSRSAENKCASRRWLFPESSQTADRPAKRGPRT